MNYFILTFYVFAPPECLVNGNEDKNDKISGHARHAANHLGKAQGLATMLRAAPYNAAR